jgi:hypothetical protein
MGVVALIFFALGFACVLFPRAFGLYDSRLRRFTNDPDKQAAAVRIVGVVLLAGSAASFAIFIFNSLTHART